MKLIIEATNPSSAVTKIIEEWDLRYGIAELTFVLNHEPLYKRIRIKKEHLSPVDGLRFLEALEERMNNSNYLKAYWEELS